MNGAPAVTRRPERPEDLDFRFALFRASRSPAEILVGLDAALEERLQRHQFAGQTMSYRAAFPSALHDILEIVGQPVGRLVLNASRRELRVVDLALVPERRSAGIGTALLRTLQAEARVAGVPLHLSVLHGNAGALRLYTRLGFAPAGATETHLHMQWTS